MRAVIIPGHGGGLSAGLELNANANVNANSILYATKVFDISFSAHSASIHSDMSVIASTPEIARPRLADSGRCRPKSFNSRPSFLRDPASPVRRLVYLIGLIQTKQLLLNADLIDDTRALWIGLICELGAAEGVDAHLGELANALASRSASPQSAAKKQIEPLQPRDFGRESPRVSETRTGHQLIDVTALLN